MSSLGIPDLRPEEARRSYRNSSLTPPVVPTMHELEGRLSGWREKVRPSDAPQKDKSASRTSHIRPKLARNRGTHENSSVLLAKRRGDWSGRGVGKASQTPSREMEGAPRPISGRHRF